MIRSDTHTRHGIDSVDSTYLILFSLTNAFQDEHCLGEEQHDLEAKVESLDNRLIGIEEQLKQARQTPEESDSNQFRCYNY